MDNSNTVLVPVSWLDHNGQAITSSKQVGHPFLLVDVTSGDLGPSSRWIRTLALIDTGSTSGRIERSIIQELDANPVGSSTFIGNIGQETVDSYHIHWRPVFAPQFIITDHTSVLDSPLGFPEARGLIGMSLLKYGNLFLDPHSNKGAFQIHVDRFLSSTGNQ